MFFRQLCSSWKNSGVLILPWIHLLWGWLLHPKQRLGKISLYLTLYNRIWFFFLKRESWDYLTAFIFFLSFSVCRLLWKPPLATATLLSGNMFSPLEQSWSGWGTLLQIDSLLLARTGQKSSRSTTVERELVLIIKKKLFDLLTRLQTVLLFSLCR